jgi:hypothetical protein
VCHRLGNPNHADAKTKYPWQMEAGTIQGGLIRRASPAMIHTYFEYLTSEYPRQQAEHGMLLVQLSGPDHGQPWSPVAARRMLARAGERAGLGKIRPHAFRHSFATGVLDASGGNLIIARDAGGWASTTVVDEIYGHVDVHDPVFDAALRRVWDGRAASREGDRFAVPLPGPARAAPVQPDDPRPARVAHRADQRAQLRPAVPDRRDPDPIAASGLRLGVCGARLPASTIEQP